MIEEPAPAAGERQRSIALVDDDRNILTTLSIALQAEGYATRVYSDGEAALKALLENPPDLAVFDIKMPRMDGMELLRRLRATSTLDRKSTRLNSSHGYISYAVFCLKKKKK